MGCFDFIPSSIPDVVEIIPRRFGDDRGYFMETWNSEDFILKRWSKATH